MAAHQPSFHSAPPTPEYNYGARGDHTFSQGLSGPGTSRQTRRLQLRNAGFRGPALPARKVTPNSVPSSTWSSASGLQASSDVENVSPSAKRRSATVAEKRISSGILQEIGNTTVTRPKKSRPRVSSGKFFATDASGDNTTYTDIPSSPPPPKTTIRPRSVKSRAKVSHARRSVSAETSQYIEHLETELAATQSQLSSITSPSVTRHQSSKMRTLNTETRQLQEELADWEAKYEQRVQEQVDKHCAIESGLRAQIRNLEQDVEDTRFRVQELESQLESTTQSMEAVEAANVDMEKRIEIMSELLATSSTKIDLHAQTPGRAKRHTRPKSMLPRFPTASSLMGSPERQPRTQPASPMLSFTNRSPAIPDSPNHSILPLDSSEQSDCMSEAESIFSEASATGDSVTSAENFDVQPNFNPWSLPPPPNHRAKPMRRMRRFGAGSLGPKPLILPSTSHCDSFTAASAPPLERSETTPAFFPGPMRNSEDSDSPLLGRRRASTVATELTTPSLAIVPFSNVRQTSLAEDPVMSPSTPSSAKSISTTPHFSSFGSTSGRNLMEELTAARSEDSRETMEQTDVPDVSQQHILDALPQDSSCHLESTDGVAPETAEYMRIPHDSVCSNTSVSSVTATPNHRRNRSHSTNIPVVGYSASAFDRLRVLFGDLWRSPVELARHLVQSAQARMRIPRSLLNVQWWLVGVLLVPMAKRRMLTRSDCCEDLEEQPLLLEDAQRQAAQSEGMAYGTMYESPPNSPSGRNSGISGSGRRRTGSRMRCPHHRRKHTPWLWIKFSITLAFAIGTAFKDGPGSLLKTTVCSCRRKDVDGPGKTNDQQVATGR